MLCNYDAEEFVICGVKRGHPFVVENNVIHVNSDGSGPMIIESTEIENIDLQCLKEKFNNYCYDFSHNKYH